MPVAREISSIPTQPCCRYSICTLVTSAAQYQAMQQSFHKAGFDSDECEFLYLDNSQSNRFDAFQAVNLFLQAATGDYIIICHQDIQLHDDRVEDLDRLINDITHTDPDWAVLGNAGGVRPGRLAIRITDPKGKNTSAGPFPARVDAIDENFMVVRRSANLSLSGDLSGYHFYGTDLCIIADILGYHCYVIDFHLHHIGGESTRKGKAKNSFHTSYPQIREAILRKYQRAFRPRWIQNTGTILYLSGSRLKRSALNGKVAVGLAKFIGKLRNRIGQ